jgi:hypothetical protein
MITYLKTIKWRQCRLGLAVLCLAGTMTVNGQEKDFAGWYSVAVNKELFGRVDFSLSPEIRTFDNHSRIDSWLIEGDASYKMLKYLKLGALYRYQVDVSDADEHVRNHRWGVYGKVTYRIKPIDFSYRCLFQQQYSNYHTSKNGEIPENVWRHKLQMKYDRKKHDWSPYVYAELFHTTAPERKEGREKLRLSGGLDYKLNKMFDLSAGYILQKEYGVNNPVTSHIISVGLAIDWD